MLTGFIMFGTALAQSAPPEVSLQAGLGDAPVQDGVTVLTTALPGTQKFLVTLVPPTGGALSVPFSYPDLWRANRDGSVSATLPVADDDDAVELLVDVSNSAGAATGAIRLEVTVGGGSASPLDIGLTPQAGWIGDTIDEILTVAFCENYVSGNSAIGTNPDVWLYCIDLLNY